MIPNIEQLKKAADRVAEFIGQKHKLRIPHGTALEAIARAYNKDSWNELVAAVELQTSEDIASVSRVPTSYVERPLAKNVTVLHKEWNKHTMAIGTESERKAWCLWQLGEHMSSGRKGIFVDVIDLDTLTEEQYKNLAQMLYIVDLNKTKEVLIQEMLVEERVIVISTGTEQNSVVSEELINAMLLSTRIKVDGSSEAKNPFTICVYDYAKFKSRIGMWAAQLRAFNVALLCTTEALNHSNKTPVMNQVEANTWHKLYLNPQSDAARDVIAARIAQSAYIVDSGNGLTIY